MAQQCFDDQMMMNDALNTQKQIAQLYNHYAGECSTKRGMQTLMGLLQDEHDMQYEVFSQMEKRGWYTLKPAAQREVDAACKKFRQKEQNL